MDLLCLNGGIYRFLTDATVCNCVKMSHANVLLYGLRSTVYFNDATCLQERSLYVKLALMLERKFSVKQNFEASNKVDIFPRVSSFLMGSLTSRLCFLLLIYLNVRTCRLFENAFRCRKLNSPLDATTAEAFWMYYTHQGHWPIELR